PTSTALFTATSSRPTYLRVSGPVSCFLKADNGPRQFRPAPCATQEKSMATTDSVFQRALSNMLTEIFDGPPGSEAYLLNQGDPGLLRQLDTIDAGAASKRPMSGKTTIAAHVDHVHFGLALLNRWAAGEANPWAGADWNASWQRKTVSEEQWRTLRDGLRREAEKWQRVVATRTNCADLAPAAPHPT